jgi:hypothetical protein
MKKSKEEIEKLTTAIAEANKKIAYFDCYPDSGSCNLDTVIVDFTGWSKRDIETISNTSGVTIGNKMSGFWSGCRFLFFGGGSQGSRRTKIAEACAGVIKSFGFSANVWYESD